MAASISHNAGIHSDTETSRDSERKVRCQPVSVSRQPVSDSRQPVSDSRQPVSDSRKPVSDSHQPVSDSRQPVSDSRKPVSDTRKPVSDGRQPVSDGPQSVSDSLDGDEVFTSVPFTPLLSNNQYSVRKTAAQAMMDVALMMANISQLRTLLSGGSVHITYFYLLLSLVIFSLFSQLAFGILILIIWVRENSAKQREEYERSVRERAEFRSEGGTSPEAVVKLRLSLVRRRKHYRREVITNRLNHVTLVLVFLITLINMFITGFGIEPPSQWGDQGANHTPS